jgi:hypothetical protein
MIVSTFGVVVDQPVPAAWPPPRIVSGSPVAPGDEVNHLLRGAARPVVAERAQITIGRP